MEAQIVVKHTVRNRIYSGSRAMPMRSCFKLLGALLLVGLCGSPGIQAQSVVGGFGISTVVGGGTAPTTCSGSTDAYGDGCLAAQATLNSPQRVAFDSAGNMYIADTSNNLIRMVSAATGIITTVAGGGTSPASCAGSTNANGDGCVPTQAKLNAPQGMLFDPQGNLYVVDRGNFSIRKITNPSTGTGIITDLVGTTGTENGCTTGSTTALTKAGIDPKEIAFDNAGNMYISQNNDSCWGVVMVSNTSGSASVFTPGTLSPFVGKFSCTVTGLPGPASGAATCSVDGIVSDKLDNLYLTLSSDFAIVKATNVSQGTSTPLTILAGTLGTSGSTGDGAAATSALLHPESSAVDPFGNIFIGDASNNKVREIIASSGEIITVAGGGAAPATCSGSTDSIGDGCAATQATLATSSGNMGVAFDAAGNLYVADSGNNRIRKLSTAVNFTLPATALKSTATANIYLETTGATVLAAPTVTSPSGDFALGTVTGCTANGSTSNAVGTVCAIPVTFTPKLAGQRSEPLSISNGTTTYNFELTGIGTASVAGFASPPIASLASATGLLKSPQAAALDTDGDLYIADTGNNVVRKITAAGVASVVSTGSTTLNGPRGVAVDGLGNLYIADTGNNQVRMVTPSGTLSTIVGTGSAGYTGDFGLATAATLKSPSGLAVDAYGVLYIADTGNNVVRKVVGGVITTIAGSGGSPSSCPGSTDSYGDGCVAVQATLNAPLAVALDPQRNLYIADTGNDVVRKVAASSGVIKVFAGTEGVPGYGGDGLLATSGLLNTPSGLTIDAAGDLYVADAGNDVVRAVFNGYLATLAGISGNAGYTGDGGAANSATLSTPAAVSVGGSDIVYVVDTGNNAVRTLTMTSTVPLVFPDTAINTTSNPLTTEVQNVGNAALTFTALTFPTYFAQQPTTAFSGVNCGTTASTSTVATLAAGAGCYLATVFQPTAIGAESGNITVTDNTGNTAGSVQMIAVSGKGVAALGVITVTVPTVTYGSASMMTISIGGTGTYPPPTGTITYAVDGGTASAAHTLTNGTYGPVSLGNLTAGNHTLTVSYSGDSTYGRSSGSITFVVTGLGVTLGVTEAPSSPEWGNSVTATVTLVATAGNTPLSGQVTYVLDSGTVAFPLTVTNGSATIALGNALSVACHKLTVNYNGSTQYGAATQVLNFCVTAATTVTTISGPSTVYTGNPANFTAIVTSATGASTAGGTVLFEIGTVVICTSTVTSTGTATCSYTFGAAPLGTLGSYNVVASYQATTNFLASNSSPLSVLYSPADFTIIPETPAVGTTAAAPTSSITVTSGGGGTGIWVAVQGNDYVSGNSATPGYQGTVNLSCAGLPAFMGCTITPVSVTLTSSTYTSAGGIQTVTSFNIAAYSSSQSSLSLPYGGHTAGVMAASFFFPALFLAGWIGKGRRGTSSKMKGFLFLVVFIASLGAFCGITGCGYNQVGVPPGTYQIQIVGTDTTNNIVRSTPLSVTFTQ